MTNMETPTKACTSEDIDLFYFKFTGIIYKPNISLYIMFRLKPVIIQKGVFVWSCKNIH